MSEKNPPPKTQEETVQLPIEKQMRRTPSSRGLGFKRLILWLILGAVLGLLVWMYLYPEEAQKYLQSLS